VRKYAPGTMNIPICLTLSQAHPSDCPQATIVCPDCGSEMARRQLEEHADECLEVVVPCTQNINGCPWTGKRSNLSTHIGICPYEAIKGFLAMHAKDKVELRAENITLREQVSTLKTHIRVLHQDVTMAKQLLGPWYRSEVPPSVPQPVSAPSEMTVPLESVTNRRRLSNPLSCGVLGFPDRTSEDGDLLNSPPFSFYSQGSLPLTQGEGSSVSVLNDFTRSQPQSPIPPVNLNTTLEGSLNSLRNSIVQLSTSLDTVSRRQDMNFTTEMLRMHEEVGSLRAIVHGLRMQACRTPRTHLLVHLSSFRFMQ
jgi:TRAF-type zinc finger